ncbi:TPA: hypothetical protein ACIGNI_002608 [Salmonella enterica]|nr:hypothetical protein [Salmonella enterica]EKR2133442.1 hypothetical protein [Salmonella enterica subsp. enterica serovar Javiana]EJQ1989945.1 hypothetical protein [Salmonella enterica]EJR5227034.1 hypothetical protein [Salmonella enterica]EJS0829499.1 hypothetical protein [Salmonella enterica]
MQKKEPVIIAGDFNNEELYRWLVKKAESFTQLRQLHIEKASLEERLANVKKIISVVTNESQLEISLTDQDPTQHQDSQGS